MFAVYTNCSPLLITADQGHIFFKRQYLVIAGGDYFFALTIDKTALFIALQGIFRRQADTAQGNAGTIGQ